MKTSDTINELADALSKAQAKIRPALKDSNNPAFNSKYADLSAVWEVARGPLTENGLCVIQMPVHSEDNKLHLTTRLAHKSGQWIEETMSIPVGKENAHGYGSAITYCKRFGLSAALGIVADVDDDGYAAAENAPKRDVAAIVAASGNGADVNKEAFDSLAPEVRGQIRDMAMEVLSVHSAGGDLHEWVEAQHMNDEEKMGLWSLLPANVRRAIKDSQRAAQRKVAA